MQSNKYFITADLESLNTKTQIIRENSFHTNDLVQ